MLKRNFTWVLPNISARCRPNQVPQPNLPNCQLGTLTDSQVESMLFTCFATHLACLSDGIFCHWISAQKPCLRGSTLRSVFRCKPCFLLATTYLGCHKNGKSLSNKCSTPFFLRGSSHAFTFNYLSWLMPSCPWFRRPARRTLCLNFSHKGSYKRQYNRYMNKLHQAWGSDQL